MEIRLACEGDIPGIINLLRQVGGVHHDIRPDIFRPGAQKYDEGALRELLADAARPIFVAVEGEAVLGHCFCELKITEGSTVLLDSRSLYIHDLCVEETCRGQHVGRQLYDYVCAYARETGCQTVTLNVWCGNESAMIFYEKQGMKPRNITMEMKLC